MQSGEQTSLQCPGIYQWLRFLQHWYNHREKINLQCGHFLNSSISCLKSDLKALIEASQAFHTQTPKFVAYHRAWKQQPVASFQNTSSILRLASCHSTRAGSAFYITLQYFLVSLDSCTCIFVPLATIRTSLDQDTLNSRDSDTYRVWGQLVPASTTKTLRGYLFKQWIFMCRTEI